MTSFNQFVSNPTKTTSSPTSSFFFIRWTWCGMIATTLLPTPSFKCQKLGLSSTSAESGPINNYHNNSSIDFTNTPDIINSSNSKSLNPVDGIWSCLPNSPSRNIAFSTGNILKNPTYYYFSRQSKCKEEVLLILLRPMMVEKHPSILHSCLLITPPLGFSF